MLSIDTTNLSCHSEQFTTKVWFKKINLRNNNAIWATIKNAKKL